MKLIPTIRKHLRPVRRLFDRARIRLLELPYKFKATQIGSADWLIKVEVAYGGYVTEVARNKVSPRDTRSAEQLAFGGMTGGDRMLHNGYAPIYARFLKPFLGNRNLRLAEFGVLTGTGLAMWCDLFPDARVLGFDIDPGHYQSNKAALQRRGAFLKNAPEIVEYDQLQDGTSILAKALQGQTLDIVIDDGLHSLESILMTWRSVRPHLSSRFVYFIEDYAGLIELCGEEFAGFESKSFGMMTVIFTKPSQGENLHQYG